MAADLLKPVNHTEEHAVAIVTAEAFKDTKQRLDRRRSIPTPLKDLREKGIEGEPGVGVVGLGDERVDVRQDRLKRAHLQRAISIASSSPERTSKR